MTITGRTFGTAYRTRSVDLTAARTVAMDVMLWVAMHKSGAQ